MVIVAQEALFPPAGWELAAVAGCFVWSGQWAGMDVVAYALAMGHLQKHGQERRWRMAYRSTLKDLGVA